MKKEEAKGINDVAMLMDIYMDKFGMPKKMDAKKFVKQYFDGMEKKVLAGVRLPLPLNLGYIQGLEHLYPCDDKEHLRKFGNLDYSVIWMRHPMFKYHSIKTDPELNTKLRAAKEKGLKVLDKYVEGDYYIIKE